MLEERFIKLVEEYGGFEFAQAYRNDVDHILGGKNGTFWYVVMKKGKVTESCIGKLSGGAWEDVCVKGSGANKKTKPMPSGSTIKRIAEKAYLMQACFANSFSSSKMANCSSSVRSFGILE